MFHASRPFLAAAALENLFRLDLKRRGVPSPRMPWRWGEVERARAEGAISPAGELIVRSRAGQEYAPVSSLGVSPCSLSLDSRPHWSSLLPIDVGAARFDRLKRSGVRGVSLSLAALRTRPNPARWKPARLVSIGWIVVRIV